MRNLLKFAATTALAISAGAAFANEGKLPDTVVTYLAICCGSNACQ